MKPRSHLSMVVVLSAFATLASGTSFAQALTGAPATPQEKYSTVMPPGVASPDKVDTHLGTLVFSDGFPDAASVDKPIRQSRLSTRSAGIPVGTPASEPGGKSQCDPHAGTDQRNRTDLRAIARLAIGLPHRERQHCLQLDVARPQQGAAGG